MKKRDKIHLKIMTPEHITVDADVTKIIAEGVHGSFCLKPLHIDFLAALKPGLFLYYQGDKNEHVMAVSEGILVKCGDEILVSAMEATEGTNLRELENEIRTKFKIREAAEEAIYRAFRHLEADLMWHLIEMEKMSAGPGRL